MVHRLRPIIAFAAVLAAAGSVTAAGLTFTAHTVATSVASLPEVKQRVLPSYVVRLPEVKAADLDISKSVEVKPKIKLPVTVPAVPVTQAAVTTPVAPAEPETKLVASVTPLSADTVEPPSTDGAAYLVRSDVFVRSGPSKNYGQVGTVSGGTRVNVTNEDGGWLQISYSGGSGWVYQRFLTPAGTETVAEADTGRAPF
jgi:uncharacterized protein YgiM (DUF1202 family)